MGGEGPGDLPRLVSVFFISFLAFKGVGIGVILSKL